MKKRVRVKMKKITKKTVKKPQKVVNKKSTITAPVVINNTLRNFWELFSDVKNHNFELMMRKGNYIQDFIKLVEELPEEVFQIVFIHPCNLTPIHIKEKIDCGCPINTQCFCIKEKTVKIINKYNEYLKTYELDKYEVEIQHLRYLIELQQKGVQVPSSYSMNEFLKRSGAPDRSQTNLVVKRYDENTHPALKDLKEKHNEEVHDSNEVIKLGFTDEIKEKESNASELKSSLQSLADYTNTLKEETSKSITPENSLPSFWQELKSARELFDKFDDFYAKKQVESILALRKMNHEKEKLLNASVAECSTSLHDDIKKYLKTNRELKVIKKILKTAYQQFNRIEIVQVDPDYLKKEMDNNIDTSNLSKALKHLWPNNQIV